MGVSPPAVRDTRFSRQESTAYYTHNYHKQNGIAYLVSRAFYQGSIEPADIPKDDVAICLQVVLLVHALSTKKLSLLGSFLEKLFTRLDQVEEERESERNYECPNCRCQKCRRRRKEVQVRPTRKITVPPIPRNLMTIRASILKGRDAFIPNLPHPKVYSTFGHWYVLPSDCIKHFMAKGNTPLSFHIKK